MPEFSQDIEIEPYEYIDECSVREINDLIDELEDRGYIKPNSRPSNNEIAFPTDTSNFSEILTKIFENKHQLSVEDENTIINIYKKLV